MGKGRQVVATYLSSNLYLPWQDDQSHIGVSERVKPKKDTYTRKAKGLIKVYLCSIYHPYIHEEQTDFYDELNAFLANKPRNSELLIGADVNCNVGIRSPLFRDVPGPHGLDNTNLKGK